MIDTLPLDLFGEDEPEPPAPPTSQQTVACPWCAATASSDATACPECGARLISAEPPAPPYHDGICQWCGATIAPDVDACPECGWDARGESEIEMPGITTPLTENQIRSLYGGGEDEPTPEDALSIASDIVGMILLPD